MPSPSAGFRLAAVQVAPGTESGSDDVDAEFLARAVGWRSSLEADPPTFGRCGNLHFCKFRSCQVKI